MFICIGEVNSAFENNSSCICSTGMLPGEENKYFSQAEYIHLLQQPLEQWRKMAFDELHVKNMKKLEKESRIFFENALPWQVTLHEIMKMTRRNGTVIVIKIKTPQEHKQRWGDCFPDENGTNFALNFCNMNLQRSICDPYHGINSISQTKAEFLKWIIFLWPCQTGYFTPYSTAKTFSTKKVRKEGAVIYAHPVNTLIFTHNWPRDEDVPKEKWSFYEVLNNELHPRKNQSSRY